MTEKRMSREELVEETKHLLSLRVSSWQVAGQLGVKLGSLEKAWWAVEGYPPPWGYEGRMEYKDNRRGRHE